MDRHVKTFDKSYHFHDDARPVHYRGSMRLGIIFAVVMIIILGTILWKRGKPPVP
jgi:hypothetical protein